MIAIFGFGHPEIWPDGDAGVMRAARRGVQGDSEADDSQADSRTRKSRGAVLLDVAGQRAIGGLREGRAKK